MFSDSITALIRTAVPAIVGTIIAYFIERGVMIDDQTTQSLNAALIPVCIAAYYALATYLERQVNPAFGWLLGQAKAPTYGPTESVEEVTDGPEEISDYSTES